ncbi:membrane-binding protein [Rhodocytophaga aerolata]|uniref:Membrane-binding protein n=1 Tax=Rhodocytophaga aerolata TaxID=455078 RepID=A0ABT8R0A7_9BACT|nr:membrane-binding protein [Rhodocytophaga aerolata]MDO1445369.1 membrane-binding protein [Rhodocytophaga aerolata]
MINQLYIGKIVFCLLFVLLNFGKSFSQTPLLVEVEQSCTYTGEPINGELYEFRSSSEANMVVRRIMEAVGLKPRFELKAANVDNAAAVIYNSKRYILYSQNFISQIEGATRTNWAAISILAHEIGHHLNGHTLDHAGSRPSSELEADEFSGFVLRKMGASLHEAQAAMRVLAADEGSYTHPAKNARLEAISVGWKQADETVSTEVIARQQETPQQETVAQQYPSVEEPVYQPEVQPKTGIDKQHLIGKVVFNHAASEDYYLTKNLNLIKVGQNGIAVVGKIAKSTNEDFPLVIYNDQKKYIYVSKNGDLYNADGDKIGYTTHI